MTIEMMNAKELEFELMRRFMLLKLAASEGTPTEKYCDELHELVEALKMKGDKG